MNNSPLQLAMRELRSDFRRPVFWVALTGTGAVLALAGAFGTGDVLRPVPLFLYWIAIVVATYCAGALTVGLLRRALGQMARAARVAITAFAVGLIVVFVVGGVNTALFGWGWASGAAVLRFGASTLVTAFIVSVILDYAFGQTRDEALAVQPALVARLPLEKRGPLVSLSAVDHYVEVTTTKGKELVLIRLADAIAETRPTRGLQIHRSHWVAQDHVCAATRGAGKASVTLSDGRMLPVSRSNLTTLKEHGLLPD